jgi:hypothetical protein
MCWTLYTNTVWTSKPAWLQIEACCVIQEILWFLSETGGSQYRSRLIYPFANWSKLRSLDLLTRTRGCRGGKLKNSTHFYRIPVVSGRPRVNLTSKTKANFNNLLQLHNASTCVQPSENIMQHQISPIVRRVEGKRALTQLEALIINC